MASPQSGRDSVLYKFEKVAYRLRLARFFYLV